ncbi:MAG: tRNA 2-thiouridine(34) synthase MnmA [Oscillospiraceae bacterium]|nr:tRNA 2-thiouridine(34) synthase MnmA [Oscillospiraceae bacterium]
MAPKVVLGLSGGVDSAAAALLLKRQGYEVHGVWLDLGFGSPEEARGAAAQLGIGFSVFDAAEAHERLVRAPFAEIYRAGRTPNPCAVCNPGVKLPSLLRAAEAIGAEKIATGHYAAVEERLGRPCLRRSGTDKDQSYMLALVGPEILGRLLLPLSGRTKPENRALAQEAGLHNAGAPDSQDICFIPDGDYGSWLEARGQGLPEGSFVDASGRVLGRHRGLHRYTVGQRRGLGVSAEGRLYVLRLRREDNAVVLGQEGELMTDSITVGNVVWGAMAPAEEPFRCEIKPRSRPARFSALVTPTEEGLRIDFDAPLRRPAPGQLAVGYDQEGFVLFGGTVLEEEGPAIL